MTCERNEHRMDFNCFPLELFILSTHTVYDKLGELRFDANWSPN